MKTTILTDIEGTTSSISFVKDVLFPYARRALPGFVRDHRDDPEVRRWLDVVATEHGSICSDDVIVETLQGWIDQDRKHTALKALQGGSTVDLRTIPAVVGGDEAKRHGLICFSQIVGNALVNIPVGLLTRDDWLGLHALAAGLPALRTRSRRSSK